MQLCTEKVIDKFNIEKLKYFHFNKLILASFVSWFNFEGMHTLTLDLISLRHGDGLYKHSTSILRRYFDLFRII